MIQELLRELLDLRLPTDNCIIVCSENFLDDIVNECDKRFIILVKPEDAIPKKSSIKCIICGYRFVVDSNYTGNIYKIFISSKEDKVYIPPVGIPVEAVDDVLYGRKKYYDEGDY